MRGRDVSMMFIGHHTKIEEGELTKEKQNNRLQLLTETASTLTLAPTGREGGYLKSIPMNTPEATDLD